jgi:Tfp pilus assembly protein PilF
MKDKRKAASYLRKGMRLFWGKAPSKSIKWLKKSTSFDSTNPWPYYSLGMYYVFRGNARKAEPWLERTLKVDSGFARAWSHLAAIQEKIGKTKEARESIKKMKVADKRCMK